MSRADSFTMIFIILLFSHIITALFGIWWGGKITVEKVGNDLIDHMEKEMKRRKEEENSS